MAARLNDYDHRGRKPFDKLRADYDRSAGFAPRVPVESQSHRTPRWLSGRNRYDAIGAKIYATHFVGHFWSQPLLKEFRSHRFLIFFCQLFFCQTPPVPPEVELWASALFACSAFQGVWLGARPSGLRVFVVNPAALGILCVFARSLRCQRLGAIELKVAPQKRDTTQGSEKA